MKISVVGKPWGYPPQTVGNFVSNDATGFHPLTLFFLGWEGVGGVGSGMVRVTP